jgi:hypothetical protein
MKRSSLLLLLAFAVTLNAQVPPPVQEEYERVVIPFNSDRMPGAFGTVWRLEGWVWNPLDERVRFSFGRSLCVALCPGEPVALPGLNAIGFHAYGTHGANGMIYYTNRERAPLLTYHLRLFRESAAGVEFALSLPVIREGEFRNSSIQLLDLPNTVSERVHVRI